MKRGALSFSEWCEREQKPQLLALYDVDANPDPPSRVPFSSPNEYNFRCPVCGITWAQKPNKLNRLKKGSSNVIKQREEDTFCPYCKGTRPSPYYNLATVVPAVTGWWDHDRNSQPPEAFLPSTHQKFYLKCSKCGYALPRPVNISDRGGILRCPRCGNGRSREVMPSNCLEVRYPQISQELDEGRNGGITGKMIFPYSNQDLWFLCPHGHRYHAKVSNRTCLDRGCPVCNEQQTTSFTEQAVRFYLQKCAPDLRSRQPDPYTGRSVDILLPGRRTAIEFNSRYYHSTLSGGQRAKIDAAKAYALAQYYRVYIIAEQGAELPIRPHPLIEVISAPVFNLTKKICRSYDRLIYELLQALFPDRDSYPSIDIMRDQLLILQQYISTPVDRNFEELYPLLAADWEPVLNGTLTPSMFRPTSRYHFFWICRNCKKVYRMSMANRLKVNPDTCPRCCRKSRYKSPMLVETYPFVKSFWSAELNAVPLSQVSVASEAFGIFELLDGRIVPVRVCNLSAWLYAHPDRTPEQYLNRQWTKLQKSFPLDSET